MQRPMRAQQPPLARCVLAAAPRASHVHLAHPCSDLTPSAAASPFSNEDRGSQGGEAAWPRSPSQERRARLESSLQAPNGSVCPLSRRPRDGSPESPGRPFSLLNTTRPLETHPRMARQGSAQACPREKAWLSRCRLLSVLHPGQMAEGKTELPRGHASICETNLPGCDGHQEGRRAAETKTACCLL